VEIRKCTGGPDVVPGVEALLETTDEELVRAGDTAALVRRYYGPVFGLARRLLGGAADARDAAQETFARAIAHLRDFQPGRSFRAWLFSIAANLVRDLHRRRRTSPLEPAIEETLPDLAPPDARMLSEENRERLAAAVERLPFDLKAVVALHFQEDLPPSEIAEALGISPNAVRIRLYRALAALRKEFA
jgi:RNA polymerase sigma-70 factor (ECF subfamily)